MLNKKFGLALGGGGARGIAHIGVVKKLLQNKIYPDYISGSSIGAMIGAFLALETDWDEIESVALGFDKKTATKTLFDFGKMGQSVLKGEKVKRFLEGSFGDKQFSDTKIPLEIVACDLSSGEEIIIKEGLIREAVMASICVPGIFPPVRIGERLMIDGGVVNPTPVDIVKAMGAEVVVGIDLISKYRQNIIETPNMINTLFLCYEIIRRQAMEFKLKQDSENIIIIRPEKRDLFESFKFYDVHEFIQTGEESMAVALPELLKLLGRAK
jgi:NTE family protein